MTHIYSYPTVYALGHSAIRGIFSGPVVVEEKIDGSQFSMALLDGCPGELVCRSKGKDLVLDAPEQMFVSAVETARSLALHPGWVYRCEFLSKPKHNTLAYSRVPAKGLIVYDIGTGLEAYQWPGEKMAEAERLGLEVVPVLQEGMVSGMADLEAFLERDSILGGTKVEGVVVKNYSLFTPEKKVAMGKYVSERFKEVHNADWRLRNPAKADLVQRLIEEYHTEARWEKGIQHLREMGMLEGSPRDIGPLIREVPEDVKKECEQAIKDALFDYAWPAIQRGIVRGLPEWYKRRLAEIAFQVSGSEEKP
jgi:ATP-dependent RNA circularization protein (DNA/RNA ligase family)